ncbi:MAG: apolipoprotein N-acyltransferase [Gammaproteobacteria bacterium]|jgi:apolipoprotein N-acyltransferase|nr:apolipoprotein N-acyltransferase [Gammaproteobacteria bacterium]
MLASWKHWRVALSALAGAMLPLSFAPLSAYPLALASTALFFLLIDAQRPGLAARCGFAFGFAAFLAGTYWLYISVHHFGKAPLLVALPVMFGLIAFMAAWYALLAWMCARWLNGSAVTRLLLAWPAAWVTVEWLRGWVATGFPWLSLGYSQLDSPLAGFAPLAGVYGVSWAVALVAGGILLSLLGEGRKQRWLGLLVALVVWLGGGLLRSVPWTAPEGDPALVMVAQGNVAQDMKWLPEQRQPTLDLYRELTLQNLDSELIVWPEAALPNLVSEEREYLSEVWTRVQESGGALVLGVLRLEPQDWTVRNSLLALGEEPGFYDKRHLVPFGEFFPVPGFVRNWLRLLSLPYSDIEPGPFDQAVLLAGRFRIAPSICYEDAFGAEQRSFLPEANLLVNISNDAWFGDSVAPHQHLQMARMRALESGRFLIRSTNTGVSAVVDNNGQVMARSPQFKVAALRSKVQLFTGATPYILAGNAPVMALALIAMLAGALLGKKRRHPSRPAVTPNTG